MRARPLSSKEAMITLDLQDLPADFEFFHFSAGEPHIKIPDLGESVVNVLARIDNWDDYGKLLVLLSAVSNQLPMAGALTVYVPYFPAARMDRQDNHTPLTVDIYAEGICAAMQRGLCELWLCTFDLHSKLAEDRILACAGDVNLKLLDVGMLDPGHFDEDIDLIIAPDKGAVERATTFRDFYYPTAEVIYAEKARDFGTGHIDSYRLPDLPRHYKALVVDDICDGGRTPNLVAQAWFDQAKFRSSPHEIQLYVSHGLFSRGIDNIDPLFSKIYTTDSHCPVDRIPNHNRSAVRVKLIPLPLPW